MHTQHMQPAFMQAVMQSQQPWIMAQQPASPLVQVIVHPSLVISHLHMAIAMLQEQMIMIPSHGAGCGQAQPQPSATTARFAVTLTRLAR